MFVVILGGGESGIGAALLAVKKGFDVFLSDINLIEDKYKEELEMAEVGFEEGQHSFDKLKKAKWAIKSPGIPNSTEIICQLRNAKVEVISEIEFAFRFDKSTLIAITGTNGKTTTTGLCKHILEKANFDVAAVGNIGVSYSRQVAMCENDFLVCEVSSFQLDDIVEFKPAISILLNISSDHLDRYDNIDQYTSAKLNIARKQVKDDLFIYFDKGELQEKLETANFKCEIMRLSSIMNNVSSVNFEGVDYPINNLQLKGPHNAENVLACIAVAVRLGISNEDIISGIQSFKNESHRLEFVGSKNGRDFVDDSKATNVDAAIQALRSFDKPVIWIVGGVDKGNDYSEIIELIERKAIAVIAMGKDNVLVETAFGNLSIDFYNTNSMREAIDVAINIECKECVVLMSPACASFDLFENYKDRGDQFKTEVRKYLNEQSNRHIT